MAPAALAAGGGAGVVVGEFLAAAQAGEGAGGGAGEETRMSGVWGVLRDVMAATDGSGGRPGSAGFTEALIKVSSIYICYGQTTSGKQRMMFRTNEALGKRSAPCVVCS